MSVNPSDLLDQAKHALDESRYGEAEGLAQQAEALTDDAGLLARALEIRGFAAHLDTRYVEARGLAESALSQYVVAGDQTGQVRALYLLGNIHREINDIPLALDYHQQQVAIALHIGDLEGLTKAYNGMAGVYQFAKQYDFALDYLRRVLDLARQTGDRKAHSLALTNSLQVMISIGGPQPGGHAIIEELEALYSEMGDRVSPNTRTTFYSRASRYHLQHGEIERAFHYIELGLALTERYVLHRRRAVMLGELGDLYLARGQYGLAIPPLLEAVAIGEAHGVLNWMDGVLESLIRAYERMGDFQAAFIWQKRFMDQRIAALDGERQRIARQIEARFQVESARREADQFRAQADQSESRRQTLERINKLKTELLANTSHDIKNPLTSIRLTLDLLRRADSVHPVTRQRHITHINEQIDRITRLIGNMLDLARLETSVSLRPAPIDIHALFNWAIRQHAVRASHGQVRLMMMPLPPGLTLMADPDRIEQVIDNLVSNAVKYTPPGGMVVLDAMIVQEGQIEISIRDTGLGIPEADIPHLFDPFYRVERPEIQSIEGTGLGLAIAQTIIQQHGSTLRVASTVGQGSTFSFTLASAT